MKGQNNLWVILAIGALVLFVVSQPQGTTSPAPQPGVIQAGCNIGSLSTLKAGGYDPLGAARSAVNAYVVKPDGSFQLPETSSPSTLTSLDTSAPNTFSGSIYIGNDNNEGTDRGTEYYFTKQPVSWNCEGAPTYDLIPTYAEGTLTLTVKDNGVVEASPNITVGSGATVDTTSVQLAVSASAAFGNPQLSNPISFCANATTPANWDTVRPLNYVSTIPVPEFLAGRNFLNGACYVLPTNSIVDSPTETNTFEHFVRIRAAAGVNPGTEQLRFVYLDKTYQLDDNQRWVESWEDRSDTAADGDIGAEVQSVDNEIF